MTYTDYRKNEEREMLHQQAFKSTSFSESIKLNCENLLLAFGALCSHSSAMSNKVPIRFMKTTYFLHTKILNNELANISTEGSFRTY